MAKKKLTFSSAKGSNQNGFRVSSNGIAKFNPSVINQTTSGFSSPLLSSGTVVNFPTTNLPTNSLPGSILDNTNIFQHTPPYIITHSIYTPKDKITVPISPITHFSDEVIYTSAKNSSETYYLPKYRIGVHRISGEQQFRIALEQNNGKDGGQLIIYLEKYASSKIERKMSKAKELAHKVEVSLSYLVPSAGNLKKELKFQEITLQSNGIRSKLNITDLREYAQIYHALSDNSYKTQLIINRKAIVAIPRYTTQHINKLNPEKHKPDLVLKGFENYAVRGKKYTRVNLSVRNRHLFPDSLFKSSPDLPPCGGNKNASRTWVNIYSNQGKRLYGFCALSKSSSLASLSFAYRRGEAPPEGVYIVLEDRRAKKKYISNTIPIAKGRTESDAPLYKVSSSELENQERFVFPPEAFGYIFKNSGLNGSDNQEDGYIPHLISWKGSDYTYLQDATRKERIFYLPDEFQLMRLNDGVAHWPWFRIEYRGSSVADLEVKVSYRITGYIDPERLESAYTVLSKEIDNLPAEGLIFEPLRVGEEQLSYKLALPGEQGFTERKDVLLDLLYIDDELPWLSIQEFTELFHSLLKNDQRDNVLRGQINVKLNNLSIPPIRVAVRFGDMIGEVFHLEPFYNTQSQKYLVALKNLTESIISAGGLSVKVKDNSQMIDARCEGISFPLEIAPGTAQTHFNVIPQSSVADIRNAELLFSWNDLDVMIDKENIYSVIVDPLVPSRFSSKIMVRGYAFLDDPTLLEIKVDFRNTESEAIIQSITLVPGEDMNDSTGIIEEEVVLPLPLKDYILELPTANFYQFRVTSINQSGGPVEGEWQINTGSLAITSDRLPTNVQE